MSALSITQNIAFVEKVFGKASIARNFKNLEVWCPMCAPSSKEKRKLAIKLDNHFCHCWTCGYRSRSLAPLIFKYARSYLDEYKKIFSTNTLNFKEDDSSIPQLELPRDFSLLVTANQRDPDVIALRRYVTKRGLTENDLWYYKLGISNESKWARRVIVPSFDKYGKLNYFVARAIDSYKKHKYENPDIDKLPIIFNEINVNWSKQLVLCEGAFDMFKCGYNVVPMLGSDLNEESQLFNTIILNNTPIALALDGDMWHTKMLSISKKLQEYNIDVNIIDTRLHHDPGSMSTTQFQQALESSVKFDWSLMFKTKLSSATKLSLRL